MNWLELTPDYACNNRCVGCFAVGGGGSMTSAEILQELRRGRADGIRNLWIGGGEPTLRRDLFPTIRAARALGYQRIKLQTNGMLLAYPEFADRCIDAGLTEVNFAIKGGTAETHDRLTRTPGAFDLLWKAVEDWRERGVPLMGDVLVYRSNLHELPELVRRFHHHGIDHFNLWMFSTTDQGTDDLREEMPRISDLMPRIREVLEAVKNPSPGIITSLHTPPCTLPEDLLGTAFSARDLGLLIANPGGHRFLLETSPIEGGAFLPRCDGCAWRQRCNGPREDYLHRHGDAEFQPVAADRAPVDWPVLPDLAAVPPPGRAAR